MIVSPRQAVSLHTYSGIQLGQFLPEQQLSLSWGRELKQTSKCQLLVPFDETLLDTITPWLQWISVFDDNDALLWQGPIQQPTANRNGITITALDPSSLAGATRVPITKRWDAADPATIAGELWKGVIDNHGLALKPVIRSDPEGSPFDYGVQADTAMVDTKISELVNLGLKWTVVAGTPLLGPAPLKPILTLSEDDFMGDPGIELTRDGSKTFNDVLLRAKDTISRQRRDMGGLNRQTIVNVDSLSGVSNADRAAAQYVQQYAGIRTVITLPKDVEFHPDASVGIEQLIPSTRFVIEAYGIRELIMLDSVTVECASGSVSVKGSFDSVPVGDPIELDKIAANNSQTMSSGGV